MSENTEMKKKLCLLHDLYGKHNMPMIVAGFEWGQTDRAIVLCECGAFIDAAINPKKAITPHWLEKPLYAKAIFKNIKNIKTRKMFSIFYKTQTGKRLFLGT